jgi:dihydrofolate reductase
VDASEIADDDVVYYLAASLDGFIAGKDGDVSWLNDYFVPELGFHDFMARVGTAIMGRRTFDTMLALTGDKYAYGATPSVVVTSRPLPQLDAPIVAGKGSPEEILDAARRHGRGPFWVIGGADIATQLLERGLLTRIDLFTVPVLLGDGISPFRNQTPVALDLASSGTYPKGITRTSWRPRRP